MNRKNTILVIAPHPDDDLIGCGGSIAKHLDLANRVCIVYVTNGDAFNSNYSQAEFTKLRIKETHDAAQAMGLKTENLFFLEETVWDINPNKARLKILALIRNLKPDICYVPHSQDEHVDHKLVHQIAMEAIKMAPGPWFKRNKEENSWEVPTVLAYEVWTPLNKFGFVENITDFIEKKSAALCQHKSQIAEVKYNEATIGLNRYRGAMTGKGRHCECFEVLKISNVSI